MLRHCLATLAYRGGKVLRGAPDEFASYRASESSRTPAEIVAHLVDLLDWALSIARGQQAWKNSEPVDWQAGADRFFTSLTALDQFLASNEPLDASPERLFQAPGSDALTPGGQLTMLP